MNLRYYGILLALTRFCRAWRATYSDPTQCEDMTVSWNGSAGEQIGPPFVVKLAAFGLAPLIVNIPTTAWSDTTRSGSYRINIPWPGGTNFVAAMNDGFMAGAGGITGIQTVKSSSNSSCITPTITQPDHVFDVSGTFIQCSVVSLNWTEPTSSSTEISGLVPNGTPFRLDPPLANSRSTSWNLNILGGTAFALIYTASSGPGFVSRLLVSQASGGTDGCLSANSPSKTAEQTGIAEATSGAGSPTLASGTPTPIESSGSSIRRSPGPVIGATLGAFTLLAALVVLAYCLYRRKRRFTRVQLGSPGSGKEINLESDDLGGYGDHNSRRYLPEGAVALPFVLPSTSFAQETQSSNRKTPITSHSTADHVSRDTLIPAESSYGSSGTSSARQDRHETEDNEPVFIQHADGGAVPIQPRAREVIELPPNYDQLPRRLPRPRPSPPEVASRVEEHEKIQRIRGGML